jgi:tRNA1(Val) A37 N6-methylase TrmN6
MCFVYPKLNRRPVLVLLKGIKGAKQGLIIKPPLCIYSGDGSYTTEIKEIYSGGCDNG